MVVANSSGQERADAGTTAAAELHQQLLERRGSRRSNGARTAADPGVRRGPTAHRPAASRLAAGRDERRGFASRHVRPGISRHRPVRLPVGAFAAGLAVHDRRPPPARRHPPAAAQETRRRPTPDAAAGETRITAALVELAALLSDRGDSPSQAAARGEVVQAVHVGLSSLPDDQREAVRRRFVERQDYAAAAKAMGRSPEAVRSLVYRAKHSLRDFMGRSSRWFFK